MSNFATDIGAALKQQREAKGWPMREAAKRTGYSVSSIRNMERGNDRVLWSRYCMYMSILGITWKLVPKKLDEAPTT